MSMFHDAYSHALREELNAGVFQICLKNDQQTLALRQTWPILQVLARRIPPKWRADKGAQGPRTFVLLLMVLTRIPPPEPGFFLCACAGYQGGGDWPLPFVNQATRASGNSRLKLAVVCSASCS